MPKPADNKGKTTVVSFQLKDTQSIDCGGGYLKIMRGDFDPKEFHGESDY